jgi:peptidoglycan/xylan/chitin deacetylase (PgdA/CDA1 family)
VAVKASVQLRQSGRIARLAKRVLTRSRTARWHSSGSSTPACRILTYHRVADDRDPLAVPTKSFQRQMRWLADERMPVTGVSAALAAQTEPSIALSFDDGFADVLETALPILRELGFGATLYIVPGVIDGTALFDWYGAPPPPAARWDRLAAAVQEDFEVGAHTLTHPVLTLLSTPDCAREIAAPREVIDRRLGVLPSSFSYPAGVYDDREKQLVREAGYVSAVTSRQGRLTAEADALELPRIPVERHDSLSDFISKVYGGHDRPVPFSDTYRRWLRVRRPRGS